MISENFKLTEDGRYAVTENGRVFSLYYRNRNTFEKRENPYEMKTSLVRGYKRLILANPKRNKLVHNLVLELFVGPRPEGCLAAHKNDIKTDNRLENLYWATRSENAKDAIRNGKFPMERKHGNCKLSNSDVAEIFRLFDSGMKKRHIANKFGVKENTVGGIINRNMRKYALQKIEAMK